MKPIVFKRSRKGVLVISGNALQKMLAYIQCKPHATEAGGVLLGRFILNCPDIIIDDVTTPLKGDKRSRTSLWRSETHQRLIDQAWHESEGTKVYLGEWHTHPEIIPTYSSVDERNWQALLNNTGIVSPVLYFIIVGIEDICIWQGSRKTRRRQKAILKRLRRV